MADSAMLLINMDGKIKILCKKSAFIDKRLERNGNPLYTILVSICLTDGKTPPVKHTGY